MILIVSESSDQSTNEVINWLIFWRIEFIRINENDFIKIYDIEVNNSLNTSITFSVNKGRIINTNDISSYWFRRGFFNFFDADHLNLQLKNKEIENKIKTNLKAEISRIGELFQSILESKNKIGSSYTADNNKLIHLSAAKSINLKTPQSMVCTSKKNLKFFFDKHPEGIITKPISDTFTLVNNSKFYNLYTNIISEKDLKIFPESFYPTLVQEKIDKKFEIRVFFLKNKFYSMAIFSQNDDKTKIDFRRYNKQQPNYRVPFNLPADIKNRLSKFMRLVKLDCGSIDMIYSTEEQYYFLEVNPVGQFGMVSYPCNYQIEKQIANELIKSYGKKNKI